jgi:hypothetical protein
MSEIFISYAREDRPRVRLLADALVEQGWSVWWDSAIPFGKAYDRIIEDALTEAKCVIVAWSRQSVDSDWVRAEAAEGHRRRILMPVLIDCIQPPLEFRHIQAADLVGWEGGHPPSDFNKLVADLIRMLGSPAVASDRQRQSLCVRRITRHSDSNEACFIIRSAIWSSGARRSASLSESESALAVRSTLSNSAACSWTPRGGLHPGQLAGP